MESVKKISFGITTSGVFKIIILLLILLSGVLMGLETYPEFHKKYSHVFHIIDWVIIYIFVFEIILKLLANGKKPWLFFTDPWNVFDFIIVLICFIPVVDTHFVVVFRLARVLRVFRMVSVLPKLQVLVNALLKSIPSMGYVIVLLFLVFYIYAVLGYFLFSASDPVHFGNLHSSMISLFKILTLEGWTDIMNIQLYGTPDPAAEYSGGQVSYKSVAYFVSFILIGAMIIMNLFIGVIMSSIQESQNEIQEEIIRKNKRGESTESLLKELEEKIDDLKHDIKRLNDNLKYK